MNRIIVYQEFVIIVFGSNFGVMVVAKIQEWNTRFAGRVGVERRGGSGVGQDVPEGTSGTHTLSVSQSPTRQGGQVVGLPRAFFGTGRREYQGRGARGYCWDGAVGFKKRFSPGRGQAPLGKNLEVCGLDLLDWPLVGHT